jgi:hemolysin activation/secretion protein
VPNTAPNRRPPTALACLVASAACALGVAAHAAEGPAAVDAATAPPDAAASGGEPFDILEIRVLGSAVLPARDVEAAIYPHLGPGRTMADVEAARDALVALYRERGYGTVLVDIPEQTVEGGLVRLQAIEGRLGAVRISGTRYYSNRAIRTALGDIQPGTTPRLPDLQERLTALARQSPDRQIVPILKSGAEPGTFDLELRVADRLPVHGSVEVNDRYTADTSELRANVQLSYDNLFQRGHSLALQYQASPQEPSEVQVYGATYVARSVESPNAWVFYGVKSDSDVTALGTLGVLGRGYVLGTRYVVPFAVTRERQASLALGFDYKDFVEDVALEGTAEPASTPISYVVFNAVYSDAFAAGAWRGTGNLGLALGPRGLGNTAEEFAFKRFQGRPNFVALRGGGTLDWSPSAWFARTRLSFQYAPQPLVSNEQFSVGGVDSVRGYLEAEWLADLGVAGSLEAGRLLWVEPDTGRGLSAFAFADGGTGSIENPLPSQTRRVDLYSVGAGLRLTRPAWLDARLDWAKALAEGPRTPDGDSRLHFSLRVAF